MPEKKKASELTKEDLKEQQKNIALHKKLTAETKKAYSPENVVDTQEITREVQHIDGGIKKKYISIKTYKNGVRKSSLHGVRDIKGNMIFGSDFNGSQKQVVT